MNRKPTVTLLISAILVAAGPARKPAAEWLRNGEPIAAEDDQLVTIYRFVFPVEKVESGQ